MKIYLIGLYVDKRDGGDVQCIVKATTSLSAARQYALERVEQIKKDPRYKDVEVYTNDSAIDWEVAYKYDVKEGDPVYGKEYSWIVRIEEVDLVGEDVPRKMAPALERRCAALEKHNDRLKAEVAACKKTIVEADSCLVFYDGGIYERFDHLLDCIHKARLILREK